MNELDRHWDNGFYAKGEIRGSKINFLVDNGSTVTLLSKTAFDKLSKDNQSTVDPITLNVRDATMMGISSKPMVAWLCQ